MGMMSVCLGDRKVTDMEEQRDANEEFGYRLWDPISRKNIRSRDVVFFEDRTIKDFEKPEKPHLDEIPVNLGPVFRSINSNDGGATLDTDDVDPPAGSSRPKQVPEQVQPKAPLRRSTREWKLSHRYSSDESDGGESKSYDETIID